MGEEWMAQTKNKVVTTTLSSGQGCIVPVPPTISFFVFTLPHFISLSVFFPGPTPSFSLLTIPHPSTLRCL